MKPAKKKAALKTVHQRRKLNEAEYKIREQILDIAGWAQDLAGVTSLLASALEKKGRMDTYRDESDVALSYGGDQVREYATRLYEEATRVANAIYSEEEIEQENYKRLAVVRAKQASEKQIVWKAFQKQWKKLAQKSDR